MSASKRSGRDAVVPTARTATPRSRRRASATTLLALTAGLVWSAPALADELDDIQDKMGQVDQQQQQTSQKRGDLDTAMEGLGDHLDETSTALVQADKQLKATTARVDVARVALTGVQEELAEAQDEADRIDGVLGVARANEEKIEGSLAANEVEQQESRAAVGAMARESYKNGGMGSVVMTLDVLSGGGDAVQDMAMARTVLRLQDQSIQRLSTQQAQEVAESDRLTGVRQDIALLLAQAEANVMRKADAREAADQAKNDLDALLAQQSDDKTVLEQEKTAVEQQLDNAQQESDELQTQLADLARRKHGLEIAQDAEKQRIAEEESRRKAEEEARRKAAEEARRAAAEAQAQREAEAQRQAEAERQAEADRAEAQAGRAEAQAQANRAEAAAAAAAERLEEKAQQEASDRESEPPAPAPAPAPTAALAPSSGVLSPPSPAAVTSTFGYRMHPILGYARLHAGIDYAGACGSPVYAPADGVIVGTSQSSDGGIRLLVDHGVHRGTNLVTTYSHLSGYAVTSGSVNRGQLVAYVGSTGLSTGCHLHFETRENGIPVDPFTWL